MAQLDLHRDDVPGRLRRRLYEVMSAWEDIGSDPDVTEIERGYARVWQGADKVVFSPPARSAPVWSTRCGSSCTRW